MKTASFEVKDVSMRYPNGTLAVNRVSLKLLPGEIFGLVGPNGAGKSSLLNACAGLLKLESGRVLCASQDVAEDPCRAALYLSLMPDPLGVYNDLTALQYLKFFALAYNLKSAEAADRIAQVSARLELEPWLGHEVETLSAGWQRRLALGRILLNDSPILLLDEPAAGLDITARSQLLGLLKGLAAEGRALLVTSHILSELEQLADRFGIIKNGTWVNFQGEQVFFTRSELSSRGSGGKRRWFARTSNNQEAVKILGAEKAVPFEPDGILIEAKDEDEASGLITLLAAKGVKVFEFKPHASDLSHVALDMLEGGAGTP